MKKADRLSGSGSRVTPSGITVDYVLTEAEAAKSTANVVVVIPPPSVRKPKVRKPETSPSITDKQVARAEQLQARLDRAEEVMDALAKRCKAAIDELQAYRKEMRIITQAATRIETRVRRLDRTLNSLIQNGRVVSGTIENSTKLWADVSVSRNSSIENGAGKSFLAKKQRERAGRRKDFRRIILTDIE